MNFSVLCSILENVVFDYCQTQPFVNKEISKEDKSKIESDKSKKVEINKRKCFQFFNLLGDRKDDSIDNLLVVGIYEGLYANKKCNDIARQLLTGRNKEIYEHWMINGNIRAEY